MKAMARAALAALVLFAVPAAFAQTSSTALLADPTPDRDHPARMEVVHIPTHGVLINGVLYLAAGAGPHPTLVLFHGMPGNEQNLDLAQAVRRAGWNVLTLHYRGSWGSPGVYSYPHLVEDGVAALAFVRSPASVAAYGIDPSRIVVAGHSSGGFVAVNAVARSPAAVQGLVLISGTDDAYEAMVAKADPKAWRKFVKDGFDGMETLIGCTPAGLAKQLLAHGSDWTFKAAAPKLVETPLLVVTSDDGFAPEGEALAKEVSALGAPTPQVVHFATDHPYSDHRIALQQTVAGWLEQIR